MKNSKIIVLFGIFFLIGSSVVQADVTIGDEGVLKINKGAMLVEQSDDIRDALKKASKEQKDVRGKLKKVDEWFVIEIKRSEKWDDEKRQGRVFYDVYNLIYHPLVFESVKFLNFVGKEVLLNGSTVFVANHRETKKNRFGFEDIDRSIYNFTVTSIRAFN